MKLRYSPCKWNLESVIQVVDENTIVVDGETYEFDPEDLAWPDIAVQTAGAITDAQRVDGALYLTVRRFYVDQCPWDDGQYHDWGDGGEEMHLGFRGN